MTQTYKVQVSMNQAHIVESGFVWKQGDFGFNIEIEVLDFDTTGATPQIIFRKSTGAVEATQISVASNKFTYAIRGTELDTPGPCVCDLKLKDSTTKRVSTASFKYFVIPDTMDGLEQEASSYSDTIEQIVEGLKNEINYVRRLIITTGDIEFDTANQTMTLKRGNNDGIYVFSDKNRYDFNEDIVLSYSNIQSVFVNLVLNDGSLELRGGTDYTQNNDGLIYTFRKDRLVNPATNNLPENYIVDGKIINRYNNLFGLKQGYIVSAGGVELIPSFSTTAKTMTINPNGEEFYIFDNAKTRIIFNTITTISYNDTTVGHVCLVVRNNNLQIVNYTNVQPTDTLIYIINKNSLRTYGTNTIDLPYYVDGVLIGDSSIELRSEINNNRRVVITTGDIEFDTTNQTMTLKCGSNDSIYVFSDKNRYDFDSDITLSYASIQSAFVNVVLNNGNLELRGGTDYTQNDEGLIYTFRKDTLTNPATNNLPENYIVDGTLVNRYNNLFGKKQGYIVSVGGTELTPSFSTTAKTMTINPGGGEFYVFDKTNRIIFNTEISISYASTTTGHVCLILRNSALQIVNYTNVQPTDTLIYIINKNSLKWFDTNTINTSYLVDGMLVGGPKNINDAVFVATNGNDTTGNGSISNPYATINKALGSGGRYIAIREGKYNQQINFDGISGEIVISNYDSTGRVIFEPSEAILSTSEEKVSGYNNVYVINVAALYNSNIDWLYQDNIWDENTLISDQERHPLERGKAYRCDDTCIIKSQELTLADALNDIEDISNNRFTFFFDSENGKLYYSRPEEVSDSNPICQPTSKSLFINATRAISLTCAGIETKYMQFDVRNINSAKISDCKSANAWGQGFIYNKCVGTEFIRCEAVRANQGQTGDGFNGHADNTGDPFSKQTMVTLTDCWSHDNKDDGYSDHERSEITIIGGLFEYNRKGGVTPSFGSHCTCYNVTSRNNYSGFALWGQAEQAEGGKYSQLVCFGCLAENNYETTGGGFLVNGAGNSAKIIDSRSISNYNGFNCSANCSMELIDCGAKGNTVLIVDPGEKITINNTNLVV